MRVTAGAAAITGWHLIELLNFKWLLFQERCAHPIHTSKWATSVLLCIQVAVTSANRLEMGLFYTRKWKIDKINISFCVEIIFSLLFHRLAQCNVMPFVHSPSVENLFSFRYSFASCRSCWLETDSTWWQNVIRTQLDSEGSNAGAQHYYPLCIKRTTERQKRPLTGKIDKIFVFQFSSYFLCVFMVDIQRACRIYYRRIICYYLHKLSAELTSSILHQKPAANCQYQAASSQSNQMKWSEKKSESSLMQRATSMWQ